MLLGVAVGAVAAGSAVRHLRRDRGLAARGVRSSTATRPAFARRRIVILGAGFGGISVAETLTAGKHADLDVTLIDRRNYHLFTPLLYHVAVGLVDPLHIVYPARALAARRHICFRESITQQIDLVGRRVVTDEGEVPFDDLVIALGSQTNFFGMGEAQEHALPLKTMADGIAIRNRIIDAFEVADLEPDPEARREWLTFTVVGGGATGVELAGGLYGLMHHVLLKHYPTLHAEEVAVVLLQAGAQLLPEWDPFLVQTSQQSLERRGVIVRLGARVVRVTPEFVELKGGERIRTRTVVWTAGVRPADVIAVLDVPKVSGGRLQVNEYLELPDHPGVFALGDVAGFLDPATGQPIPALAATAEQQGHAVGENLLRRARGLPMKPYQYRLIGNTLSLGRNDAALVVGGIKLRGFLAWVLWRAAHVATLRGWRNRLGVLFDWAFAYIFQRETLRVEASPSTAPAPALPPDPPGSALGTSSGSMLTASAPASTS